MELPSVVFVLLLLGGGVAALTASSSLQDGQPVYACAGGGLLLPWNISVTPPEEIADIQWYFDGRSQEMIAMYAHGNFLVMPAFSERVTHAAMGGLSFNDVTVGDTGNYTIEVRGHDASGSYFTWRSTAVVRVGDSLMTTDGKMHVTEEPRAKWDNSDQQFHVVLSCGTFTYLTYPPFEVEWTHPDGSTTNSTSYVDGKFQLHLANPVRGGNYSCRIPAHSEAMACLPHHSHPPVMADVNIDSLEARLTVLEAQQNSLQSENSQLKGNNTDLQNQVTSLQQQLLQYQNESHRDHISFYVRLSTQVYISNQQPLIFTDIINNDGNGYSQTTGHFTVPKNGTYFLTVTIFPGTSGGRSNAQMIVDGAREICIIQSNINYEHLSCEGSVFLHQGQEVWVRSYGGSYYFQGPQTAFSGFLLY